MKREMFYFNLKELQVKIKVLYVITGVLGYSFARTPLSLDRAKFLYKTIALVNCLNRAVSRDRNVLICWL